MSTLFILGIKVVLYRCYYCK